MKLINLYIVTRFGLAVVDGVLAQVGPCQFIKAQVITISMHHNEKFSNPLLHLQMSKANVFYPGSLHYSQDRIILISGTVDQLLTALHIVLTRIRLEPRGDQETGKDDDRIELRLLVHSKLCGALIGKGGVTIKSFNEDNGARIHISPPPTHPGLNERVVKITGPIDEIMRAVALVVTKLSENPDFYLLSDSNLNYAYGTIYDMHPGTRAPRYLHNGSNSYSDIAPLWPSPSHPHANFHRIEITVPIPDDQVGQIIGKEGTTIKQIKNLVNVDIQISKRGDFLPGTNNRACQISGTPDAVNLAQQVILQRLNSS